MNLSLKTATPYVLLGVIVIGVFGGIRLNEILRRAKTAPPAKTA
jgi:hypothetical protein